MTPPVFAALPVFWYAWRHRKHVVLDAHAAAFLHPRWRWLQWLQKALCRRAKTTLVHVEHIADFVREAGGHVTVVPDVPIEFAHHESFPRPIEFTVAVVCSFNYDEPVPAIFEAAAALPDVHFFVTGKRRHLDPAISASVPPNVRLTGFLTTPAYGGLLKTADVVLTLTTRDHTMLRGAYEAIYQGTPAIISDWPVLREAFPCGVVHVDNTANAIVSAVRTVRDNIDSYRADAQRLRAMKLERWETTRRALVGIATVDQQ
jgi:glycosyltransferase involved in cell wall biosynthesis